MAISDLQQHQNLVRRLTRADAWPGERETPVVIETHISSVVLVGKFAYKLKKPLDLGFLDFSTLDKRQHACQEELRLNGRLAPDLYLGVVPISGSVEQPRLDEGEPIEWAVQMRRFDPAAVLAECPQRIDDALVDQLAVDIGHFHGTAPVAPAGQGEPGAVIAAMTDNIRQIRARRSAERAQLDQLADWLEREQDRLEPVLQARQAQGFVRECHGDLHLNNIVLINGKPVIFDGIEFNAALRYIDVFADLAFLTMDLMRLGRTAQAYRLLDRYLAVTGDFSGLPLLRLYEVYRAMVRAKVAAIHAGERNLGADEREQIVASLRRYLRVASRLTRDPRPALIITHGVSGVGKSTVSDLLVAELPAVRVRSDVERKRLAAKDGVVDAKDLYSENMTARTYDRLHKLAGGVMDAGYIAVVDATFLDATQRARFAELADARNVPFAIMDCQAPPAELVRRVGARSGGGRDVSDADTAVLSRQLGQQQALSPAEQARAIKVSPQQPLDLDQVAERLQG